MVKKFFRRTPHPVITVRQEYKRTPIQSLLSLIVTITGKGVLLLGRNSLYGWRLGVAERSHNCRVCEPNDGESPYSVKHQASLYKFRTAC